MHFIVESPPSHGEVDIAGEESFPGFPRDDSEARCNDRRVSGWRVYYTSTSGFVGIDAFSVSTIAADGFRFVINYSVTVGPLGPNIQQIEKL